MDIVSHGLWGSLAFGRSTGKNFWLAFFFGVAPDLFSFGIHTIAIGLGLTGRVEWSLGHPPESHLIPGYVHSLYDVTHSLIIFVIAFGLVWWFRKKPLYIMLPWGLHILMDIPTHSYQFFPTPFLWPLSDFTINGLSWSDPRIFMPNVTLLIVLYAWFFLFRPRLQKRRNLTPH